MAGLESGLCIKPDSALNRPVEDWGKLLGDAAAVSAMLDRLLHHGHVLKCGPRSWRTKTDLPPQEAAG
jgi:DNA replication protein DnaC